jgi:hypothetical protein
MASEQRVAPKLAHLVASERVSQSETLAKNETRRIYLRLQTSEASRRPRLVSSVAELARLPCLHQESEPFQESEQKPRAASNSRLKPSTTANLTAGPSNSRILSSMSLNVMILLVRLDSTILEPASRPAQPIPTAVGVTNATPTPTEPPLSKHAHVFRTCYHNPTSNIFLVHRPCWTHITQARSREGCS